MKLPSPLRRLGTAFRPRSVIVEVPAEYLAPGDLLVPGGELGVHPDGDQVKATELLSRGPHTYLELTTRAGRRWLLNPTFLVPAFACSRKGL